MSYPQTAIHAAFGIAFFWVFTKHSWKKLLQAFVLAVLAGVVCAPWWLTVYLQHGIAPFISAASSGVHDLSPLNVFVGDLFARDTFIPILMILRVAGIIWEAAHRRFTLVLWAAARLFFGSTQCRHNFLSGVLASVRDRFCGRIAFCGQLVEKHN